MCAQLCRADVQTYCFGLAASMGAFLLGAGAKGKRYSMPNARIMIHQPLGGASGQVRAARRGSAWTARRLLLEQELCITGASDHSSPSPGIDYPFQNAHCACGVWRAELASIFRPGKHVMDGVTRNELHCCGAQAVDIEIQAKEIMYHKANLNRIMSECTGQPIEKVARPSH